ncbi:RteC domain-containing protein, partial [Psychroserpens sp.]
ALAIRNGQADIKRMALVCEKLFDIDLGNFYRTYLEIRERKMDRTRFLNLLKQSLEKRMQDDDEKY